MRDAPRQTRAASSSSSSRVPAFVLVVGERARLEHEDGAVNQLRQLGAVVHALELWDDPTTIFTQDDSAQARAVIVEVGERPDLAASVLRAVRRDPRLETTPAIVAVVAGQVARVEPSSGFDDFILIPYVPAELYARIRTLEWRKSEFLTEERLKIGGLVVDRAGHDVTVDGRRVILTAKEFALLAFLAGNRGRVFTREMLLARVWGARYEGGPRTVDIHVRRLRAKLGGALPLETLRGSGYKLRSPGDPPGDLDLPSVMGGPRRGEPADVPAARIVPGTPRKAGLR
jgi:DNA-binding response OmpR family regulator